MLWKYDSHTVGINPGDLFQAVELRELVSVSPFSVVKSTLVLLTFLFTLFFSFPLMMLACFEIFVILVLLSRFMMIFTVSARGISTDCFALTLSHSLFPGSALSEFDVLNFSLFLFNGSRELSNVAESSCLLS